MKDFASHLIIPLVLQDNHALENNEMLEVICANQFMADHFLRDHIQSLSNAS